MRWPPRFLSCVLILLTGFLIFPQQVNAKDKGEPQMVWVNYAEGLVKFSPGHNGEPRLGNDWYEANPGQVMENGYTLVTQKGRAEVEFEDGSIVYLAENSALEFDWLWIRDDATETDLSLLTGMATVAHATKNPLTLLTPSMWMTFQVVQTMRVDCALDGALLKPIAGALEMKTHDGVATIPQEESGLYYQGRLIPLQEREPYVIDQNWDRWVNTTVSENRMIAPAPGDEWDTWVAGRIERRRQLVAEGMKQSGLTEPIPGLAGMVESGKFFDCGLNGRCWQSNAVMRNGGEPLSGATTAAGAPEALHAAALRQGASANQEGNIIVNRTMMQRCPLEAWQATASQQGNETGNTAQYGPCLAGTWDMSGMAATWDISAMDWTDPCKRWDPLQQRWVYWPGCYQFSSWVVGHRHHHHHHHECHFVKTGNHGIGIVPRHALDQRGHPPVNLRSGILVLTAEKGKLQASVERAPEKGVTLVSNVPRDMGRGLLESAPRVAQPVIEAKATSAMLPNGIVGVGHIAPPKNVGTARLDFKSGNFVGKTEAGSGGHSVVVAHAGGGGSYGGGVHGGSSGGGGGAGVSGGGGGHSGGGSSGGSSGGSGGGGGGGGGHH